MKTPARLARRLANGLPLLALLSACGGGGGGDSTAAPPAPTSIALARITVADAFGAPVAGATVRWAADGRTASLTTDARGQAVAAAAAGAVDLTIAREAFEDARVQVQVVPGQPVEVPVTLARKAAAAGGAWASAGGAVPAVGNGGRTLGFEIELVVIGADANAVGGLSAADFTLLACTPLAATPAADCLRHGGADHGYAAAPALAAEALAPAAPTPQATALLVDQSGSIATSDPTDARLNAAKTWLAGLGAGDQVLLGAFAGGSGTVLPSSPLTVYPGLAQAANAASFHGTLDALAQQVGGLTALYASVDAMRGALDATAGLAPGAERSIVVFTDGADTLCTSADDCTAQRTRTAEAARAGGTRLFTIGLGEAVDVETLSALAFGSGGAALHAGRVEQLIPLYASLPRLLRRGLVSYRVRFEADAGADGVFASGQVLLARARAVVGGAEVVIPFAVRVP